MNNVRKRWPTTRAHVERPELGFFFLLPLAVREGAGSARMPGQTRLCIPPGPAATLRSTK